ncbi:hypothetical protein [Bacillus sp. FJAT-45037]|uniref:hypothetical protein n=1 Tax=Bacillus sp. FJAT-45037 TaxID=2011007 RepID=UPI000C24FE9E|nr:hypothetical protein [Bacillus sp. FJAT-45037]
MNKIQKTLVGTALSATLIAGVGVGTYSSFNDRQSVSAVSTEAARSAELILNIEGNGEIVNGSEEFTLFSDRDNLDIYPGETLDANAFYIKNDGTRAFDLRVTDNGITAFDFKLGSTSIRNNREFFKPIIAEAVFTHIAVDGTEETRVLKDSLQNNNLYSILTKGQRTTNPLREFKTLLPGEKIRVEVSLTLDESAGNEYQGLPLSASFKTEAVQNNTVER